MHEQVTADQVQQAVQAKDESWFYTRECSICHCPIGYEFVDGQLFWNGNCDCPPRFPPEPRTWQDVADLINMQTRDEHRQTLMATFGLAANDE